MRRLLEVLPCGSPGGARAAVEVVRAAPFPIAVLPRSAEPGAARHDGNGRVPSASSSRAWRASGRSTAMGLSVARKLIETTGVEGEMTPGSEIGLRIDQTLTQDATRTLVMLEFERLGIARVRTELSAQYVDHNLLQTDFRNADDHLFLRSALKRRLWFSKPGNGVSHPVHMQRFGAPGSTLLGFGLAHERGRVARDAGDRNRRPGGRAGDGRRAVLREDAPDLGRASNRGTAGLGERRTRSSRCCVGTTSTAASGASSSTTALAWPH
jgi:hypothetical protein